MIRRRAILDTQASIVLLDKEEVVGFPRLAASVAADVDPQLNGQGDELSHLKVVEVETKGRKHGAPPVKLLLSWCLFRLRGGLASLNHGYWGGGMMQGRNRRCFSPADLRWSMKERRSIAEGWDSFGRRVLLRPSGCIVSRLFPSDGGTPKQVRCDRRMCGEVDGKI